MYFLEYKLKGCLQMLLARLGQTVNIQEKNSKDLHTHQTSDTLFIAHHNQTKRRYNYTNPLFLSLTSISPPLFLCD